jgi:phage shock protein A
MIDPAILNGALHEIQREAAKHKNVLALAEVLSDLVQLHAEVEAAQATLKDTYDTIQRETSSHDEYKRNAEIEAARLVADGDKYRDGKRLEGDRLLDQALAETNRVVKERKDKLDEMHAEHQDKAAALSKEQVALEANIADTRQQLGSLQAEHAEWTNKVKAKSAEHKELVDHHTEFLRSIGAR